MPRRWRCSCKMAASSVPLPPPMSATVRIGEKSYPVATLGANAAVRSDIAAWNLRARSGWAAPCGGRRNAPDWSGAFFADPHLRYITA